MSNQFTPFVEATHIRETQAAATSGSYTLDIDHFRQGVEISRDVHMFAGTLPKLGADAAGDLTHTSDIVTYGQQGEFLSDTKFEDILRFDPVTFVSGGYYLAYPVVLSNPSYPDPEFTTFIAPLSNGSRDSLAGITDYEFHDIRGSLLDGNESVFRTSDRIFSVINIRESAQTTNTYIDATNYIGDSGSIALQGLFHERENDFVPFDEARFETKSLPSGSLHSTSIVAALRAMTGSDDQYVFDGYKVSCTGFVYDGASFGVDSLAFGGLKRS